MYMRSLNGMLNSIALKTARTSKSFGLSECSRVKNLLDIFLRIAVLDFIYYLLTLKILPALLVYNTEIISFCFQVIFS